MLFLGTCEVKAAETITASVSNRFNINLCSGSYYSGYEASNPDFTTLTLVSTNNISIQGDKYYFVYADFNIHPEVTNGTDTSLVISNFSMYDKHFIPLRPSGSPLPKMLYSSSTSGNNVNFVLGTVRGSEIEMNGLFCYPFIISGTCKNSSSSGAYLFNFDLVCNGTIYIREASDSEIQSAGTLTSDDGSHQLLEEIQEQNEEAQEIRSGIFESIKEFFGSFFDNLIHVFVPEDGFFEDWFDSVLQLLEDKFGFLFTPLDFFIRLIQAIYTADTSESAIPFPEIKWGDTVIISAQDISLTDLWDGKFNDAREKLYFVTDIISIFAFFSLLRKKLSLIIRGNEDDN